MADRYLALLRSINVGGRRVTGPELVAVFDGLGLGDGATFLTSGNVIFSTESPVTEETIATGLGEALGYEVPVFLRSADQVRSLAGSTTMPASVVETSAGKLQLISLKTEPPPATVDEILTHSTADDVLAFENRHLWWLPKGDMSASDLDLKAIERLAGPATIRTRNTINRIAAKFFAN